MKNKERIITILICVVATTLTSIVTAYATNYLYNADEVGYDGTSIGLNKDNVQDAIDEIYTKATDYSTINNNIASLTNRVSALETPTILDIATTDTTNYKTGTIHLVKVGKVVYCYTSLSSNKDITTTWNWVNVQSGIIPEEYRPKVNTVGVAVRQDTASYYGAWAEGIVNTSGTLAFRYSSPMGTSYATSTSLTWVTN